MNSFWLIEDYIFANDFYVFFNDLSKNVKRHVFLKSEKKRKIRILEHWLKKWQRNNSRMENSWYDID